MGNLFSSLFGQKSGSSSTQGQGGAKAPSPGAGTSSITPAEKAQLELKRTRDRFSKVETRLNHEADVLTGKIKEAMGANKKDVALRLLKVKKLKEAQRDKLRNQIFDLESMAAAIETEAQNAAFLNSIQSGTSALKAMQEALPLEKVQQIMDDTADAIDVSREIDEAIMMGSASLTAGGKPIAGMSAEELAAELAELAELDALESAATTATTATATAATTATATASTKGKKEVVAGAGAAAVAAAPVPVPVPVPAPAPAPSAEAAAELPADMPVAPSGPIEHEQAAEEEEAAPPTAAAAASKPSRQAVMA